MSAGGDEVPGRTQDVGPQQVAGVEGGDDPGVRRSRRDRIPSDQNAYAHSWACTQVSRSTTAAAEGSGVPTRRWVAIRRASTLSRSRAGVSTGFMTTPRRDH